MEQNPEVIRLYLIWKELSEKERQKLISLGKELQSDRARLVPEPAD